MYLVLHMIIKRFCISYLKNTHLHLLKYKNIKMEQIKMKYIHEVHTTFATKTYS